MTKQYSILFYLSTYFNRLIADSEAFQFDIRYVLPSFLHICCSASKFSFRIADYKEVLIFVFVLESNLFFDFILTPWVDLVAFNSS